MKMKSKTKIYSTKRFNASRIENHIITTGTERMSDQKIIVDAVPVAIPTVCAIIYAAEAEGKVDIITQILAFDGSTGIINAPKIVMIGKMINLVTKQMMNSHHLHETME